MSDKPQNSVPTPADFFGWLGQFMQPITEASAKLTPAVPVPAGADPLAMWKSMTEYNQQAWTQFFKQVVSTPEFAAGLGRTTSNQAVVRESVRKAAKAYLEAANMPSREDHVRLASQVVALDAKVDDVEDMLKDAELAGLNRRLDALLGRLKSLEKQTNQTSLEKKLDQLNAKLDRLANIEERLSNLETGRNPKEIPALAPKAPARPKANQSKSEAGTEQLPKPKPVRNPRRNPAQ